MASASSFYTMAPRKLEYSDVDEEGQFTSGSEKSTRFYIGSGQTVEYVEGKVESAIFDPNRIENRHAREPDAQAACSRMGNCKGYIEHTDGNFYLLVQGMPGSFRAMSWSSKADFVRSAKAKHVVSTSAAMAALAPVTQIVRLPGAEKLDVNLRMAESLEELEALFAARTDLDAGNLLAAAVRGAGLARELQLAALPASQLWADFAVKLGSIAAQLEPRGLSQLATAIPMLSEHRQFVLDSLTAATRQRLRAGGFTGTEDFSRLSTALRTSQLGLDVCPKLWSALVEEADAQEKAGKLEATGLFRKPDGSPTALGAAVLELAA